MKNSIVNIESANNNSFGTGFVIDKDEKGVYILTCQHVIEDVGIPIIESVLARVTVLGGFLDMAVIYVPKLDLKPLPLDVQHKNSSDVTVIGFSRFNQSMTQKQHIEATLYKESIELHSNEDDSVYNVRKIKAKDGYIFNRGNSGSPVICKSSGKVIAMVSNKEGSSLAYAINIENLKDVWKDVPKNILNTENIKAKDDEYETLISKIGKVEPLSLNSHYGNEKSKKKEKKKIPTFFKYIISIGVVLFLIVYFGDKEAEDWNNKGVEAYNKKRYLDAIKYYNEAIEWDSDYALAYNNLALVYLAKGEYKLALDKTQIALRKAETNNELKSSIHYNRGLIFEKKSEWKESLDNYRLAYSYSNKEDYNIKIEEINSKLLSNLKQDSKVKTIQTIPYDDGSVYKGESIKHENHYDPHGQGVYTYSNGTKYIGSFKEGYYDGYGVETYPNGDRYEGMFKDGKYDGKGIYGTQSGMRSAGLFKKGVPIGKIMVTDAATGLSLTVDASTLKNMKNTN